MDIGLGDIGATVTRLLLEIQASLFSKAKEGRDAKTVVVTKWEDFVPAVDRGCMVLTPFCDQAEWEDKVKVNSSTF